MTKDFDPDNLSFSDVVRAVAPLAVIIALLVVFRNSDRFTFLTEYANHLRILFVVVLFIAAYSWTKRLPDETVERIAEIEEQRTQKLRSTPYVGPLLLLIKRVLGALFAVISATVFVVYVYSIFFSTG